MAEFTIRTHKYRPGWTMKDALEQEEDIISNLTYLQDATDFEQKIVWPQRTEIKQLISRHLGLPPSHFELLPPDEWIKGSFNLCIGIENIKSSAHPKNAILRIPLPFKTGEAFSPGIVDEKLRCEAATYLWMRRNCPNIRIPRLLGIGFPGKQSFTAVENECWYRRVIWQVRRGLAWLRGDTLEPYFAHSRTVLDDLGYLLLEWIEDGKMLSSSWPEHRQDPKRRTNLYRSLAKIMLDLTSVPLPRIGSWTLDNRGIISLTNRPLLDVVVLTSAKSIPLVMSRDKTYTSGDSLVHDLIRIQDSRMRFQPNSILSELDGVSQLAALTALRSLLPRFWGPDSRDGPFALYLTDMHQSNIFVDDDWNVTSLIDLEFAPVVPMGLIDVPTWLSGRGIDQLKDDHLAPYKALHDEFVDIIAQEEIARGISNKFSQNLYDKWTTGKIWYNLALLSFNGYHAMFHGHLRPRFFEKYTNDVDGRTLAQLWDENVYKFIAQKQKDLEAYEAKIREIFATAEARAAREKGSVDVRGEEITEASGESTGPDDETTQLIQQTTDLDGESPKPEDETIGSGDKTIRTSESTMPVEG